MNILTVFLSCLTSITVWILPTLCHGDSDLLTIIPAIVAANRSDCNNVKRGEAYLDHCNICVGGNTGIKACSQDCNGDWGGTAVVDSCGICGGWGAPCPKCILTCSSDSYTYSCGSSSNSASRSYCYIGSTGYVESLSVDYHNGYSVNCISDHCGGPLSCSDNTGQSCTIN